MFNCLICSTLTSLIKIRITSLNNLIQIFIYRIGSLIADYTLTSKQPINQTEVEENLKSSLMTSSQVDTSKGQQSFSGTVNTATLTLKGNLKLSL